MITIFCSVKNSTDLDTYIQKKKDSDNLINLELSISFESLRCRVRTLAGGDQIQILCWFTIYLILFQEIKGGNCWHRNKLETEISKQLKNWCIVNQNRNYSIHMKEIFVCLCMRACMFGYTHTHTHTHTHTYIIFFFCLEVLVLEFRA
jgi:hypothetical protein